MCRSIKRLRTGDARAPEPEIQEAARQFVRKISGFHHPSDANADAFETAVDDISAVSRRLLDTLTARAAARRRTG